jgi:hypothetical protein
MGKTNTRRYGWAEEAKVDGGWGSDYPRNVVKMNALSKPTVPAMKKRAATEKNPPKPKLSSSTKKQLASDPFTKVRAKGRSVVRSKKSPDDIQARNAAAGRPVSKEAARLERKIVVPPIKKRKAKASTKGSDWGKGESFMDSSYKSMSDAVDQLIGRKKQKH